MSTSTTTTIRCPDCDQALPAGVNEAIAELYYGADTRSFRAHLRSLVIEGRSTDDRAIFDEAVKRWLGATPEQVVAGVRHMELECGYGND